MKFLAALLVLAAFPVHAATLEAGKGKTFALPSAAIAAASAGDTIAIDQGVYFDCAVVTKDRLTMIGMGDGAVMTDKTCQGKAILVISGRDVILRNLVLTRARVPDRNGAGIRAEGDNLTIERVRFINNENGILAADAPNSTIRIRDSEFTDNGRCAPECAHGLYVGHIKELDVQTTRFFRTYNGHHVKSRAANTILIGNDIADGPDGAASYMVDIAEGGDLLMRQNTLAKGPKTASNRVVVLGAEKPGLVGSSQFIDSNMLTDDGAGVSALVLNWGAGDPVVARNTVPKGIDQVSASGSLFHRAHVWLYEWKVSLMSGPNFAKRVVKAILARV